MSKISHNHQKAPHEALSVQKNLTIHEINQIKDYHKAMSAHANHSKNQTQILLEVVLLWLLKFQLRSKVKELFLSIQRINHHQNLTRESKIKAKR